VQRSDSRKPRATEQREDSTYKKKKKRRPKPL
jgi:hypothetical protein